MLQQSPKTVQQRRKRRSSPQPAPQRVSRVMQQHPVAPVARRQNAGNVATAMLLPITLPLQAAWWLLSHPFQAVIIAFAVYWAIPLEMLP